MTPANVIPFNPLDKVQLGRSVAQALLRQAVTPLVELGPFPGAGIYAIYYHGDFPAYSAISHRPAAKEAGRPIYVGKAVPKGARKGGGQVAQVGGTALFGRLTQHRRSIEEAENLRVEDFSCRHLVVDDIWIPLGETLLIATFNPLWNQFIDGFGNHDPGSGRHAGLRPRWDVIHPGRGWADRCQPRPETAEQILAEARSFLADHPLAME